MQRLALVLAVFTVCAAASSAATQQPRRLIGSYRLVTRIETPRRIAQPPGSLSIDTYDPSTGAITGHGFDYYEVAPASMSGTVRGSTLTMRVVNRYGAASDRGRISADGTIRGTITYKVGKVRYRGTWTMKPFDLVVGKTGFSLRHLGHQETDMSWGVEVQNVSTTRDAVHIRIKAVALTKSGRVVSDPGTLLFTQVQTTPAGVTMYISGHEGFDGAVDVAKLRVSITGVSSRPTKRYALPPVSDIEIDRANGRVTGVVTNPYRTRMSSYDFSASAVFYDRDGRVLGGSDLGRIDTDGRSQWIDPGGHAPVEALIPDEIAVDRIASAQVTVLAN